MNDKLIKIGDKYYKKAQVVMLPTEDITNVFIKGNKTLEYNSNPPLYGVQKLGWEFQYIYITTLVKGKYLKIGEYFHNTEENSIHFKSANNIWEEELYFSKVIASTDPSLTIEGVVSIPQRKGLTNHYPTSKPLPRPSDDFIKKYCELNGEIKDVLVEYQIEYYEPLSGNTITSACHPPFPADNIDLSKIGMKRYKLKVAQDNTISIIKDVGEF